MSDSSAATKMTSRLEALKSALESGTLRSVRRMMHSLHPAEIAHLLESLRPAEREIVWELVDPEDDGEVLLHVNDEVRSGLIRDMDAEELLAATDGLDMDDLADLFEDLPETVTRQLLHSLDEENRNRLQAVLAYPEDSAGGLMNTDMITVRPDVTLDVVMRYLRLREEVPDDTDRLFVVNRYSKLLGTVTLTRIVSHDPDSTVAEVMDTEVKGIPADTPATQVAKLFEDRDLVSAPVVDDQGVLLGRITIDDVVDVIREEADHSLMVMAGLDEEDDMFASVVPSARRRAVWLGVNLITAFIAAWVVGLFQATIDKVVALAVLMPIVASMGGIAGSQTLTLMIRGLALGQVERSNARWLMFKESAVAILNGIGWAILVAAVVLVWFDNWQLAAVIAVALIINLLVAALSGVIIPLSLKKLGVDPALAGSVVLTTITDVIGFFAFLGLGALFLL
ncbi:MAG: magnesium transporter [Gammaproteobacteria bacterium]|nr:magnesium transporter [Gammaproteobacteria bacterium]